MRMLITLLWRIMARLLRRVGWGGLLVPVAAMGMALAGVHLWTVALVLIALALVFRKPLLAAALLPLSMVTAGLAGLVVAALTPGGPVTWIVQALARPEVPPSKWPRRTVFYPGPSKAQGLGSFSPVTVLPPPPAPPSVASRMSCTGRASAPSPGPVARPT